jgi:hypothetical protein
VKRLWLLFPLVLDPDSIHHLEGFAAMQVAAAGTKHCHWGWLHAMIQVLLHPGACFSHSQF